MIFGVHRHEGPCFSQPTKFYNFEFLTMATSQIDLVLGSPVVIPPRPRFPCGDSSSPIDSRMMFVSQSLVSTRGGRIERLLWCSALRTFDLSPYKKYLSTCKKTQAKYRILIESVDRVVWCISQAICHHQRNCSTPPTFRSSGLKHAVPTST